MIWLFIGALALLGVLVGARAFSRANPAQISNWMRYGGAGGLSLIAAFFALTGRLPIAIPFAAFAMMLLGGKRGVLGRTLFGHAGPGPGTGPNAGTASASGTSDIETDYLRMALDHQTGDVSGTVLKGRFKGRQLSELSLNDGLALHREVSAADRDSVALIETWLERAFGDSWREAAGAQEQADRSDHSTRGTGNGGALSREEALELLGLQAGASEAEIRDAHRRLMQKCHPDHGGSNYLAARINAAKEILLS